MLKRMLWLVLGACLAIGCGGIRPPVLLEEIEPEYPREAQEKGLEGTVSMFLLVSPNGDVPMARIRQSSGHKILDEAALEYAKKLKFKPATKRGKPVGVWLTWMVKYEALPAYFQPKEYVAKIQELLNLAEQFSGEERSPILQEILSAHEEYVSYLIKHPDVNYNSFVQKFVLPEVYERWQVFWPDWPLRFVVYDDFVMRFPESDQVAFATARMLELIKQDISRVKEAAKVNENIGKKQDLFLKTIYTFLHEEYPEAITEDLRSEAEKYIE